MTHDDIREAHHYYIGEYIRTRSINKGMMLSRLHHFDYLIRRLDGESAMQIADDAQLARTTMVKHISHAKYRVGIYFKLKALDRL